MVVGCVNCSTKFVVPDDRVPETGIKVRCSKCQHSFYIKKEKPKRGGPSSVVMVDPDLIAEIQKSKEAAQEKPEGPASGVQISDDLSSGASASAPTAEETQEGAQQRRVSTQIMQGPAPTDQAPKPSSTQKLSVQKAPRASAPMSAPQEEDVLELSEVYLPPDWTKRVMLGFFILLGLALLLGVLAIIRNDFRVPAARDFFTVLINGPKKRGVLPPVESGKSFEAEKTSVDKTLTDGGLKAVMVQGKVRNISKDPHGRYYVRATLKGPANERLESERPCGTFLDSTWIAPIKSEAELEALYTENGREGGNKTVAAYGEVQCTVVFLNVPAWAENPPAVDLVVTRMDGAAVAP